LPGKFSRKTFGSIYAEKHLWVSEKTNALGNWVKKVRGRAGAQ
jgi:hypothetical protein